MLIIVGLQLIITSKVIGHVFAEGQTMESMQRDYEACKAEAPAGFDCVMVPMAVSKDYIERLPK